MAITTRRAPRPGAEADRSDRRRQGHPRGLVDVAMLQSLARRDDASAFDRYGLVIVDECHHLPAVSFAACVERARSRRWLGLTATPYRRDKLEAIIGFHCGPIRQRRRLGADAVRSPGGLGAAARRRHVADRPVDHPAAPHGGGAAGAGASRRRRRRGGGPRRGRDAARRCRRRRHDGRRRGRQPGPDEPGRAAPRRDRRPARPRRRAVRRPGHGQPRWGDGRGAAGDAGHAGHHARRRRCGDPLVDGDSRRRPRRRRPSAAPRRPRRGRRPHPARSTG